MVEKVQARKPLSAGVSEVLRARFQDHSYPVHTHNTWTLMVVEDGAVAYELDRREELIPRSTLTLLPPHIPHTGRSAVPGEPYTKTVLYLDEDWLPEAVAGVAVDQPLLPGPAAVAAFRALYSALDEPLVGAEMAALRDLALAHLQPGSPRLHQSDDPLARRFRELLDALLPETISLEAAAELLNTHPSHLARTFSRAFGISPHRYVTGRQLERARELLLRGHPAVEVARETGFFDQAHLTRHFRRYLGTTPAAFARGAA